MTYPWNGIPGNEKADNSAKNGPEMAGIAKPRVVTRVREWMEEHHIS